ncbi:MAG: ribonuclease H-like domain-containing protein [Candidatus Doudnabacteria bacterium]|nr:ribonuclease H-like domain-containing protein [Candidatus Doudnabacteria bacterium]
MAALNKIVFDVETQKSFEEVGGYGKNHLLKVSVVGVYSYLEDKHYCFTEDQVYRVGEMFQEADLIIGFNIKNFDYEVLKPYLTYDPHTLPTLDIMVEIEKLIGHRVRLDNVAQTTLGVGKSGDGLEALRMFRQGRIEELKKYCSQDVKITKEVYDYVQKYGKLLYKDYFDTRELKILFPEPEMRRPVQRQISLF